MGPPASGHRFLGVGPDAPPPDGDEDASLKEAMLAQLSAWSFRFCVNVWSRLTLRGKFDWDEFERLLADESDFRSYRDWKEAIRSVAWVGPDPGGKKWRFGIAGYLIPLYGKSAMRHELFHAAQDLKTELFALPRSLTRTVLAEASAHLWGGPCAAGLALVAIAVIATLAFFLGTVVFNAVM